MWHRQTLANTNFNTVAFDHNSTNHTSFIGVPNWLRNLIYKDECLYVYMYVCMYVCMYGNYTNSHFRTDLNQTLHSLTPWSGRDRRVCMDPKFLTSSTFGFIYFGGHCRILDTRWLPARPFSAVTLYPWFQLVFALRHRYYFVADGGVVRGSLISVILAGVSLTSRKWRRSRRQSHPS